LNKTAANVALLAKRILLHAYSSHCWRSHGASFWRLGASPSVPRPSPPPQLRIPGYATPLIQVQLQQM